MGSKPIKDTGTADVLALDPGGTTGWCVMSIKPRELLSNSKDLHKAVTHFACGQIHGSEDEQIDQVVELADMWPEAAVISESFHQRISSPDLETNVAYSPVRINAVLRWWLATEDRFLYKQSPGMAKSTWGDERLRDSRWFQTGSPHANDAIRHAATFYTRARQKPKLRHNAWPALFTDDGDMTW